MNIIYVFLFKLQIEGKDQKWNPMIYSLALEIWMIQEPRNITEPEFFWDNLSIKRYHKQQENIHPSHNVDIIGNEV